MRRAVTVLGLMTLGGWAFSVSPANASHAGAAPHASSIVLGSKSYYAPQSRGWGTVKPRTIFNGGDPSGLVSSIRWRNWDQKTATGWGYTSIFKPKGGYYPKLVRAELRATDVGRCNGRGPLAYRRLDARVPSKPGGRLGRWFAWAGTGNICRSP